MKTNFFKYCSHGSLIIVYIILFIEMFIYKKYDHFLLALTISITNLFFVKNIEGLD